MPDEAAFWKCCEWCDARLYDGDDDEGWIDMADELSMCPECDERTCPTTEEAQG